MRRTCRNQERKREARLWRILMVKEKVVLGTRMHWKPEEGGGEERYHHMVQTMRKVDTFCSRVLNRNEVP